MPLAFDIMIGFKKFLTSFPIWTFTVIWIVVMMWIFFTPEPFVEIDVTIDHPVDKIGHFICAGFLVAAIMLDYQRTHSWHFLSPTNILACAGVAIIVSTAMEIAQLLSFLRQMFDVLDIVTQIAGVLIFSLLYFVCQRLWTKHRS